MLLPAALFFLPVWLLRSTGDLWTWRVGEGPWRGAYRSGIEGVEDALAVLLALLLQLVGPEGIPSRLGETVPLLPWWHVQGAILLGVLVDIAVAILWGHLALQHYQYGVSLAEAEAGADADVFD